MRPRPVVERDLGLLERLYEDPSEAGKASTEIAHIGATGAGVGRIRSCGRAARCCFRTGSRRDVVMYFVLRDEVALKERHRRSRRRRPTRRARQRRAGRQWTGRGLQVGPGRMGPVPESFNPAVLDIRMARIRTVLRRSARQDAEHYVVGAAGITVDPVRREVLCDGEPFRCTPGEFAILLAVISEPGRVFSRHQLLQCTRDVDRESTERAVDVHIMNLRKKIEVDPRRPVRRLTVSGVGYKVSGGRR
ncbi:winged helix-turn-helix domain-containing protein [Streptomyces chiangmaiensis]